jgi:hypothetical protein
MKRFIHSIAACAALALPSAAIAADHEISLELGTIGHGPDDNWFLVNDYNDYLGVYGVRLGYAVHDRVAIIGGWQRGAHGTRVEMDGFDGYGDEYYDDDYSAGEALAVAYYADTFSVGAKADWGLATWFRPYATLQAQGIRTVVRLDDDTSTDDNPNQLQYSAFSPAGAATGGLDFRIPFNKGAWAIASYLELGYHVGTKASFDELGSLSNRGMLFRWGLGARF